MEIEEVFEKYFAELYFYCDLLMQSNFDLLLKKYYAVLYGFNEMSQFKDKDGVFEGQISGIDARGKLQILSETGLKMYDLKEVEFVIE